MAAEKVKERLRRATKALADAGVPYAVVGGNAVAEWVARVDEDAVRNTRDVDILIRRADLPVTRAALETAGFVYQPGRRCGRSTSRRRLMSPNRSARPRSSLSPWTHWCK